MPLVETDWLKINLNKVKIIDCSWHMPQTKRDGFTEYKTQHIQNSIFFDLDNNSKKDTELPHMLVEINEWEKIVSKYCKIALIEDYLQRKTYCNYLISYHLSKIRNTSKFIQNKNCLRLTDPQYTIIKKKEFLNKTKINHKNK